MAENIVLNNVTTFTNDTTAVNTVNGNNTTITTAFTDCLSRSGVSPNQMISTLDMNNNQIINLPPPSTINSPARLIDVTAAGSITINTALTGTSGHVVPFLDGNNTWSGVNLFNPPTGLNIAYLATANLTGTTTSGFVASGIDINSDNINGGTANSVIGFQVNQVFGGAAATGARYAVTAQVQLNAPTSTSNTSGRFYSGLLGQGIANTGDGGTSPTLSSTSQGQIFGIIGQGILGPSATSLQLVSGGTFQTSISATGSVWGKSIATFQGQTSDAAAGSGFNTMLWLNNQNTASVKWINGILIDNWGGLGAFPLSTAATIFKVGAGSVTAGIDLGSVTFSGAAFASPGFSVGSAGVIFTGAAGVSNGQVIYSGTTSGSINTNVTATSSQLNMTSTTNSTILGIGNIGTSAGSITLAGLTSGSAQITVSATGGTISISNQLNVGGSVNSGAVGVTSGTIGLFGSTSGSTSLSVDATGNFQITGGGAGLLKIGAAGSFTANGTVATSVTSLGPTGASTTVVKWLTITDNTGATRYIPCF